ncbi:MAG: ribonuclease HII [bacterium]|nr:ribonuclease HII [bacterium]
MKFPATFDLEKQLWEKGLNLIAGIDEVGRGAWAGPVVAAAVVFPQFFAPSFRLYDSKLLGAKEREDLATKIWQSAFVGIGIIGVPTINKSGIGKATQKAFRQAAFSLQVSPEHYLIDAFYISYWNRAIQTPIKSGDKICASIAAASVVAKVYRDDLMRGLAQKYPAYGLHFHKGYGTKAHQRAIARHKLSRIHRRSFNLAPYLNG